MDSLVELLTDKRQTLILYPMNKGTYLELLVIFYINVLRFNGSGRIFHNTEMNDWMSSKCNFVRFDKNARAEEMEERMQEALH